MEKRNLGLKAVNILTIILVLALLFMLILNLTKKSKICFTEGLKKECFSVELALTSEQQIKGLQDRNFLPLDKGMLFVFSQEGKYAFWMKDTLIPLDIIWLNKNVEIIHIEKNLQPCLENLCESYIPDSEALYVLEINAGFAEKFNLETGNKAEIYI